MNSHFDSDNLQLMPKHERIAVMTMRIRKLLWLRMDDEAECLIGELSREQPDAILSPVSSETD